MQKLSHFGSYSRLEISCHGCQNGVAFRLIVKLASLKVSTTAGPNDLSLQTSKSQRQPVVAVKWPDLANPVALKAGLP